MLYSKAELGLLVGKKINKENLKKLFKRYFIDWIADGYIGKNLNIFEISTITGETDKDLKIISNLMVEALENQENLKIIYQNFSIEVKEIFETVALGEKFIIKEEDIEKYWLKSLDKEEKENFDLKDEFAFFQTHFSYEDKEFYFYLDDEFVSIFRNIIETKGEDYYLRAEDDNSDIIFKMYRDNNESEFINNMNFYLDFYNSGEIIISNAGKILKDSKKNMQKHCGISEYYNDVKGLEFLKTETICLILNLLEKQYRTSSYFCNKNIKNIIDDFISTKSFSKEDKYIYTNLFLNFLKGTRNIWKNSEKIKEVSQSLVDLLKEIPGEGIVDVEKIAKAFIYRNKNIELISFQDVRDYIYINEANGERAKILKEIDYENYIIEPFVKSYLFLLGIFGVFEIFYEKPFFKKGLYLKNNYLSKYDGIKYVKLTNLGKFIFGFRDSYELPRKYEKVEIELDDKRQLLTIIGEAPARKMFFEKIATKIKDNMFKVTYDSFSKGVKTYDELVERIGKFKENVGKKLPANWEDFFGNLEKKFNSIRITDDYIIFKLEDNKDLIQAIIKDARFKKIALKAENYHLLVLKENVKELIRLLAEYGYYLIEK